MGGDGEFVSGKSPVEILVPFTTEPIVLAPGTGGGCVKTGPFAGMLTHLGPITQPDPTADNARCLKRDLNPDCAKRFTSFRNTTDLITSSPSIREFRLTLVSPHAPLIPW